MHSPGTSFDPDREVLSMVSTMNHNSTKTTDFVNLWSNSGLQPNHHFFLVFQLDPLSPYHTAPTPTPTSQSTTSIYAHFPLALSCSDRGSRSPALTGSPSPDEHGQSTLEDQLRSLLGISEQQMKDAHFLRDQPLFHSIKNWNSIVYIIDKANNLSEQIGKDAILQHFSWAITSYRKKKRLFTWAREASEKEWSGLTSTCKALCFLSTFLFTYI